MSETRICKQCGEEKQLNRFYNRKAYKDGYSPRCKDCYSDQTPKINWRIKNPSYQNQWASRNRDKTRLASMKSRLKHKYKISYDNYLELKRLQNNSCAICGKHESELEKSLCTDHSHFTGEVRGLLCDRCNKTIGQFEDNVELLQKAIDYLNK